MRKERKEEVPILTPKKESCCGCSACFCICPVKAIQMLPDKEGFLYPQIDEVKCILCNQCISVCVFKKDQIQKGLN